MIGGMAKDPSKFARSVLDQIIAKYDPESDPDKAAEPKGKNEKAQAAGKLGGLKGGKARAAKLSPAKRKKIASKGAKARWGSD